MTTRQQYIINFNVVVLTLFTVSVATELVTSGPRLKPENEAVFKSGKSFQLVCEANKPIEWKLPTISHHIGIDHDLAKRTKTTDHDHGKLLGGYQFRSTLDVNNANYMDTGYYTCHHKGNDNLKDPRVAVKTYVYVEDDEHLIVNAGEELITVILSQSAREVIPCKPSSPSVEMTLELDDNEINLSSGLWSYDPREGFINSKVALDTSGWYTCKARLKSASKSDEEQSMSFVVQVQTATAGAPKPFINQTLAQHAVIGQPFHLNCSAIFDLGVRGDLSWTVPNSKGIDGTHIRTGKLESSDVIVSGQNVQQKIYFQVLHVSHATANDAGIYTCKSIDHNQFEESEQVFVKINAAHKKEQAQHTQRPTTAVSAAHPTTVINSVVAFVTVINFFICF